MSAAQVQPGDERLGENSNATLVKKRRRRKKESGGGAREGAVHPDRARNKEMAVQRLSHKINKATLSGELQVDYTERDARRAAHKAKVLAQSQTIRDRPVAKRERARREALTSGARMAGGDNVKRGCALWLHRRCCWRHHPPIVMPLGSSAERAVRELGLTQSDLRHLKMVFDTIDCTHTGSIDHDEFYEVLMDAGGGFKSTMRTDMADYLYDLIDLDGNGTLEFDEIVSLCGAFAIFSRHDIARFIFDCFDKDGNGHLDENELQHLLQELDPEMTFPGTVRNALQDFDSNKDGLIDFGEFCEIFYRYPTMFYGGFYLQDRIHKVFMGEKRWTRVMAVYAAKRRCLDIILTSHGELPSTVETAKMPFLQGRQCARLCQCVGRTFCNAEYPHPVDAFLGIDPQTYGYENETKETVPERRYRMIVQMYGAKPPPEPESAIKEEKAPRQIFGYKEWRETAGKRAKLRAGEAEERVDSIEKQAEDGEEWFVQAMGGRTTRSVPAAKVVPDDGDPVSAAGASAGDDGAVATGKRHSRSMKKKKKRKKDDKQPQAASSAANSNIK